MHPKANYFFKISMFNLVYCWLKFRTFQIIPFKNVRIRAENGTTFSGQGRLMLGIQWHLGRYMPSQMVLRKGSQLRVNGKFRIYSGHSIWINRNARLILGSGYINNSLRLSCFNRIEMGDNVAISEGVTIWDSDCHCVGNRVNTAPIKIEDNVWIGLNSVILKGVTIGENSVVAAGSVVTRDVPPHTLVAGVPAVIKRTHIEWGEQCPIAGIK